MGIYLNPLTAKSFTSLVDSPYFVDQTESLNVLCRFMDDPVMKYTLVSRPRRFGKTVAANMVASFFGSKKDAPLFARLKIARSAATCTEHQGKYNVIFIDMSSNLNEKDGIHPFLENIQSILFLELGKEFPYVDLSPYSNLSDALGAIYQARQTEGRDSEKKSEFVFVIDEWDAPLRLLKHDEKSQRDYVSWLNTLLKGKDYLSLAYMTGILPIKKYGDDSLMNMFNEYSMTDPGVFAPYMGFTEEDVATLCERNHEEINDYKAWYDGYLLTISRKNKSGKLCKDGIRRVFKHYGIYNPKSIYMAFAEGDVGDYWDKTGSFTALQDFINLDLLGLRTSILEMMSGERKPVNVKAYKNNLASLTSLNQVYTLLIHLGYLTYDAENEEVFIPNKELMEEFATATTEEAIEYVRLHEVLADSMDLLKATWDKQAEKVAEAIEKSHGYVCAPIDYNNENALSLAVTFAYYSARAYYTIIPEAPAGKGYADLTFIPVDPCHPAMVVELKWKKEVHGAIDQIRRKNYTSRLENYAGNILCVGISYEKTDAKDPLYKKHTCVIEVM